MRTRSLFCLGLLLVVLITIVWLNRPADGCAALPPLGRVVQISGETAIIVWDADRQIEHFIRSATFETDADSIGFLVPTPSQPSLHEVDQGAFHALAEITAPKIVPRTSEPRSGGCGCSASGPNVTSAAPDAVRVLDEQRVAGHDAVVLEADDPAALAKWLEEHAYPSSPQLSHWLEPYVAAQWKITAFKYVKDQSAQQQLSSAAIRLTFKTDKPLYPYREPAPADEPVVEAASDAAAIERIAAEDAPPERMLRVFFVGPGRVQGILGEADVDDALKPWPAATVWAGHLGSHQVGHLARQLKLEDMDDAATWWLTEFEDASSPRPGGDDLYFSPAKTQQAVERPPQTASHRNGDATMYLIAAGMLAMYGYLQRGG